MPGMLCVGPTLYDGTKNAKLKNSKAFAEGVAAGSGAHNPHETGSEAYQAFAAGVAASDNAGMNGCAAPKAPAAAPAATGTGTNPGTT